MDIFEALLTRRSIRKFTDEKISEDDIQLMLKCAMMAPSAKNEQPWQFIVVEGGEKRLALSKATPYTGMAANAPLVIVVCGDMEHDKAPGFWVQDCSAAIENLLLAARGRNIGSVWCGVYPEQERVETVRNILGCPSSIIPLGIICLGHPAQAFKEAERFNLERIHREGWQSFSS